MRGGILCSKFIQCCVAGSRNRIGSGCGRFIYTQDDALLPVQLRIRIAGVVDLRDIRDIRDPNLSNPVQGTEKSFRNILGRAVGIADPKQPGIVIGVVHIASRHGEVLRVDKLCELRCR